MPAAPSWAGARTRQFDDTWSIYNPQGGPAFRTMMQNITAQRMRVLHIGDSESRSYPPTPTQYGQASVATRVRAAVAAKGLPVGTGMVVPTDTSGLLDWRWTKPASWAFNTASADGPFMFSSTANAQLTFVSDVAGTVVDVLTYGNTAAFTVTIDGVSKGAIVPSGAGSPQLISFTGLSNATHTVVITNPSTGTSYVIGASVRSTVGFEMTTMGQSGVQTSVWLPSYGGTFGLWSVLNTGISPDVVVVTLGANEMLGAVPVATYKTRMMDLLDNIWGSGRVPVLSTAAPIQVGYNSVTQAQFDSFMSCQYDLADFYDIPLIDVPHRLGGTWSAANTSGWMSDQVHPNSAGYQRVADCLAFLFLSNRPGSRFIDRWDGTKLVRINQSIWDGTKIIPARPFSPTSMAPSSGFRIAIVGRQVFFATLAADPENSTALTYSWDFGDGTTGTGAAPSRTYASAGTRTVTCTVTDAEGASSVSSRSITVA